MGEYSKVERDGRLLIVTINRPEVYNALHPMANQELSDVFDGFAADPELWVAIITGAGDKAFSAGNDLKYHAKLQKETGKRPVGPPMGFGGLTSRFDLDKPVIAAVNGVAMGGGFEIALACDLIIASDKATFALPEPRVGLAAGAGGMQRLPRMVPLKQAMGMMLTGRHVSAQEGLQLGFVTAVVPPGLASGLDEEPLLSGVRSHGQERGHDRGAARVRREAQAELEGAVTPIAPLCSRGGEAPPYPPDSAPTM
jgi:enoyl-CoA hydratase/carnithine racemase